MDKGKPNAEPPPPKPNIPEELMCNLCQDLLTDAVLVPCCADSYCDDCELFFYVYSMIIVIVPIA